jgi:hypothetical protein
VFSWPRIALQGDGLRTSFIQHWHWCPAAVINVVSCRQACDIIVSLVIAWPGGNGADCVRLHGIIMLLVCLYIFSKFHLAMGIDVQLVIEYDYGLCVLDSPPLSANMLRQNTTVYTISMITVGGRCLNEIMVQLPQPYPFMVRLSLLISGVCVS